MRLSGEAWREWSLPAPGSHIWEFQDGRCAWCGETERLFEDHCHRTGLTRGLLCRSCNNAEGQHSGSHWDSWRHGEHPASALRYVNVYVGWYGDTQLFQSAALSYYTDAEREAWWETLPAAIAAGAPWPTEAPWTEDALARRQVIQARLREIVCGIPGAS